MKKTAHAGPVVGKSGEGLKKGKIPRLPLIIAALIGGIFGVYLILASHAAVACDQTVSSVSAAQTAVSSASGGSTVCITAGSYASITLSGTHSSNVTFQPDSSVDPNGAGKVTFSGINVSGSNITVHNFYSTRGLNFLPPANHDTADHNDVTNSPGGYGIDISCNGGTQPGCSYITMNGNRIHDLESTNGDGDAFRLDGWSNVTITANEEFNIIQHEGSDQGHTDCLQSYNANVDTHDIVFDHNYQHDNQCQGFFLKDGDVSHNVTVTNNLLVRGNVLNGPDTNIFLVENTDNAIIRNNTTVRAGGSVLEADGSGAAAATVDHNVFDQFNNGTPKYNLTENNNIFMDGNQWSFTLSPTDIPQAYGVKVNPVFMCGSTCGNGTVAGDDYRLASNPSGIGINWAPSQYTYGPVAGGTTTPPADTTAPTVSLTAPVNNATVSGSSVTVTANASDDTGVAGVQFKVDGNNAGAEDTVSPYSATWDTTTATNGTHTLTAIARDAAGNTKTSSSVTVTVSNSSGGGGTQTSHCFAVPSACGYPDATNTGVPAGTNLTASGSITASINGQVIDGKDITGGVTIAADNVTIRNSKLHTTSGGTGTTVIQLNQGADNFTLEDSEVYGNGSTTNAPESGVWNHYDNPGAKVINSYFHGSPDNWEGRVDLVQDSYMRVDAFYSGAHSENIYICSETAKVDHSTLFNIHDETATVFGDTICGGGNNVSITNSLLGGGGFITYPNAKLNSPPAGVSVNISNNRIARCLTASHQDSGGGYVCASGADNNGYWPYGGHYGVSANVFQNAQNIWQNNVWDDNSQAICPDGSAGCGSSTPPPSDTTAPTVSFTSPTAGSTVSGTVTAVASASDDTAVTKVELSLDGTLKMTDTASPYNYSFDSKTLTNGSHTLTAKAYDAAGNTKSATITVNVSNLDTTPPNAPTNLNATAANPTTVNLTWTASTDTGANPTGVTKYNVLRNGVVIAQPTTTTYTDSNRVANTTYSYTVQAVDGANNTSANSAADSVTTPGAVDTTAPTVPANLTATAASINQVNLSWNASTDSGGSGLAGYNIYRNGTKLNTTPVATTTYGDSTASANTNYSYKVEAVDGSGNKSTQTTAVSATTPAVVRGDVTGPAQAPDGKIDIQDVSYEIRNYNTNNAAGDVSGPSGTPDGKVDIYDLSYIIRNYGK